MDSHTLKDLIDKLGGSVSVHVPSGREGIYRNKQVFVYVPATYDELLDIMMKNKLQCFYDYDGGIVCCLVIPNNEFMDLFRNNQNKPFKPI